MKATLYGNKRGSVRAVSEAHQTLAYYVDGGRSYLVVNVHHNEYDTLSRIGSYVEGAGSGIEIYSITPLHLLNLVLENLG